MAMEMNVEAKGYTCPMCGRDYPKRRTNFAPSYAPLYKSLGYISICKECINKIFNGYLTQVGDAKCAVRATCRKLDLYWSENIFNTVEKQSSKATLIIKYIQAINGSRSVGKCYDDSLIHDNTMWDFKFDSDEPVVEEVVEEKPTEEIKIPKRVMAFWGPGYTPEMYEELEQRKSYWLSKMGDVSELDVGAEAIIRQICNLEIDINRDRRAGKPIDKYINTLNTLLGSASLKPAQKKEDTSSFDNRPLGKWIQLWEEGKPVPDPDPELEDVDGLRRYIHIWVYGHLAKMLGVKNSYSKMYEEEIAKYKVERVEVDDDDNDSSLDEIFGGDGA